MKKYKLIKPLLGLTILTTISAPLISCSNNQDQNKVTVTFTSDENGSLEGNKTVKIEKGTLFREVITPVPIAKTDFFFDNWYANDTKLESTTKIEQSMTITAKFVYLFAKEVNAPIYVANVNDGTYLDTETKFNITHFNNSPVGYAKLADVFPTDGKILLEEAKNKSVLTNNYHQNYHGKCIIDYKQQTITFDDLQAYKDMNENSIGPMTPVEAEGRNYFAETKNYKYQKGKALQIDLNKYNIRVVWYKNNGYVPFEFLKDILECPFIFTIQGQNLPLYLLDYNGSGLYHIPESRVATEVQLKAAVKATSGDYYSQEYMEYIYHLLALVLDFRFGMIERKSRVKPGETIKYLDGGALKALSPYHDSIVSTNPDESSTAIRTFFKEQLDDAGHTAYLTLNAFDTKPFEIPKFKGKEMVYSDEIEAKLTQARSDAKLDPTGDNKIGDIRIYPSDKGKQSICYLTFDTFRYMSNNPSQRTMDILEFAFYGREKFGSTNESNYNDDTIRFTMWANSIIQNTANNIGYVVVDLSKNTGGAGFTESFVASWLCNGVTQKYWDPKTDSYCEYTSYADVNDDGKFDTNDCLSSDIQLFIITSSASFSCGNVLPCNVKDQRPDTVFIGHNSGGGPCLIEPNINIGLNSYAQLSGNRHLIRLSSTPSNPISMDDGYGTPDIEIDEINNPGGYYKREELNKYIWKIE